MTVRNVETESAPLEFGADAVRVYARPGLAPGLEDLLPGGTVWEGVHVAALSVVPAVGISATVRSGDETMLPPLEVPMTLDPGTYSVWACARLQTAPESAASLWCTAAAPMTIE